jgi:hypothetical protein
LHHQSASGVGGGYGRLACAHVHKPQAQNDELAKDNRWE